MKKFISLLLAIVILATCVPYTTFASNDSEIKRYTVLVLDTSGSTNFLDGNGSVLYTADTAVAYVKQSASKFLEDVLDANGTNYVAVVSFKSTAQVVASFSTDANSIKNKVNSLSASGSTRDISAGLSKAQSLLSEIPTDDNIKKNVVLFTTGMTNAGSYSYSGKFDSSTVGNRWQMSNNGVKLYAYANNAVSVAEKLKNEATLYTLGLFKTYANMPDSGKDVVELFKLTAKNLATSEEYFYEVDDPNDLEFTFGDIANDIINETKEITFTYASAGDKTAKCYYTNDYFAKSSYIFNSSLATMSMSFAWSAFGSSDGGQSDYSNKSKNAKALLESIGVKPENIKTNDWFTKKPTTDSIGVIAGNMPITVKNKDYTLIAVAVRGGGYEQEWASNFTIGRSGQHHGFDSAKESVLSFLKSYVSEQNITGDIKFWITGYSRAAATANLVAGAIDNQNPFGNNIKYTNDDVFAYCFETPAGALTSQVKNQSKYNNIFNIINSSDPVPYVAPAALGFSRYGIDKYLPSAQSTINYSDLKENMLNVYNSLDSTTDYIVDSFKMKKLAVKNWLPGGKEISFIQDDTENNYSQGVFLSNYVTIVSKEFIKNRNNYVDNYQNQIREICSVMFGCTDKQSELLMASLVSQAKNNWGDLALGYLNPFKSEEEALQVVSNWLKKAVKDAGITGYDEKIIDSAGKKLGDLMLALISNHPNYFTTAVVNGSGLGAAHFPELCYSWLASMDKNYGNNTSGSFNNGGYRIIRINCPVDIELKDSEGNLLASIVDEKAGACDSSLIYGIDDDGQKFIVLPISEEYNIKVIARENSKVNIGISEYCAQVGDFTRNINYFGLDLEEGELITGTIPAYKESEVQSNTPDGSTAEYTLRDFDNDVILPNSDLKGDESMEAYYSVNAWTEDETKGYVLGSAIHQFGQFAQVEAIGKNGYGFVGWYVDGELISCDEKYRVLVEGDIDLEAKFELIETCTKSSHVEVILPAEKATCLTTGLTEGKKCSVCGVATVEQKEIKATGHKEVILKAVVATYTNAGKTEGKKCSVCGKVTVEQKLIAKLDITKSKVSGLKAKKVKVAKSSEITLTWTSLGEGVKYEVYVKNGKKWKKLATTSKTSYTVKKDGKKKSLKADKAYKFRVRAVVDGVKGKYSSTLTVKTVPATATLKLKAGKKQLTASWSKVSDISGYEVQYSTSKKFTKKTTKTSKVKKSSKKTTIKKLKKGKKYYVRIRTYKTVNGKKIYSNWSKFKNVKVK